MMRVQKNFLLLILDGFGYSESTQANAITAANTPTWDYLWAHYPHLLLNASGIAVGLPDMQIGNSEVGHMTIGAGRTIYQELTRIDQSLTDASFEHLPVIQETVALGKKHPVHLMGLFSPGGVHSHENHFFALMMALVKAGCKKIYIHAFLDGRDVPPQSAESSLKKLMQICKEHACIKVASITGRYYAMDRDHRWERIEKTYDALTLAKTDFTAQDPLEALEMAYARGETDEFVRPTWIGTAPPIENEDVLFFVNFRADRARELSEAFLLQDFRGFVRKKVPQLSAMMSMVPYADHIPTKAVFTPQDLHNTLGEYLASLGKTQLRIAETEKYAHVTFFFNGGREKPLPGEERLLIPSPKVATYNLKPEMSAYEVTDALVNAIATERFDLLVCNLANPDMVGHTGDFEATVKAIEVIDACLKKIWDALRNHHGDMLVTADHGNADCMFDGINHQPHTAHTLALVPLVYVGKAVKPTTSQGVLADIAPTVLSLMGINIPKEMTGKILFN